MRPFADVLRDMGQGKTYEQLGLSLAEVVEQVMLTRKAGQLTLKLKVKPNGETSVIITDDIETKIPQPSRGETLFYAAAGGNLVRNDPRQQDLPLRTVEAPPIHTAEG